MVINLGMVKENKFEEIKEEKVAMCKCVTNAKANYIKTSTVFSTGGATEQDLQLFAKNIGKDVLIKAEVEYLI